jgi:uncharacterized protein (DUF58 family)
MDKSDIYKKIKNIQVQSLKLSEGMLAGNYRSVFKGQGIEFDSVRDYSWSDDSRFIDWNVSARFGHPYIKTFREERELNLFLVVDMSQSMHWSSLEVNKLEAAGMIAALFSMSAANSSDRVGAVFFTGKIEKWIQPMKGRRHAMRLVKDFFTFKPEASGSDLGAALEVLDEYLKKRGICIIISDFRTESGWKELTKIALKHDVIAIKITDKMDFEYPPSGLIELADNESGNRIKAFGHSKAFRRAYRDYWEVCHLKWLKNCRDRKIDHLVIDTAEDPVKKLLYFFRRRALK